MTLAPVLTVAETFQHADACFHDPQERKQRDAVMAALRVFGVHATSLQSRLPRPMAEWSVYETLFPELKCVLRPLVVSSREGQTVERLLPLSPWPRGSRLYAEH